MILVTLKRYEGTLVGYTVSGHAGFASHGQDIVCAAVSALTLTTALSLRDIVQCNGQYDTKEGQLDVAITQPNEKSTLLMQSMLLGLREIARQYPTQIKLND